MLVCRQHGSLSEPSRSWRSHLCNGAQDGLAAAVWGRHHFPKTQLTTFVHMLMDRESRRGSRGGGAQRMCLDDTASVQEAVYFVVKDKNHFYWYPAWLCDVSSWLQ